MKIGQIGSLIHREIKLYVGDLNELIFNFLNVSIFLYTGHPIFLRMIKEKISCQLVNVF